VSWTIETRSYRKLSQNFRTSHGKWWIPIRLTFINLNFSEPYMLSLQHPISDTLYTKDDWIMIDIQQAGKYVSKYLHLFIFIFIHIFIYILDFM